MWLCLVLGAWVLGCLGAWEMEACDHTAGIGVPCVCLYQKEVCALGGAGRLVPMWRLLGPGGPGGPAAGLQAAAGRRCSSAGGFVDYGGSVR